MRIARCDKLDTSEALCRSLESEYDALCDDGSPACATVRDARRRIELCRELVTEFDTGLNAAGCAVAQERGALCVNGWEKNPSRYPMSEGCHRSS